MFGHNAFGENQKAVYQRKHCKPTVMHSGGGMMISACFTDCAPYSHWADNELLWISKYSKLKCEAFCLDS